MSEVLINGKPALEAGRESQLLGMAEARANAHPLPGALKEAFTIEDIKVGPYTVRPLVPFDEKFFVLVNSPILLFELEMQKPENLRQDINYSDDDEYVLFWQFTNPVKRVREYFAKGKQPILDVAREEVGDNPKASGSVKIVFAAAMQQVINSRKTMLQYAQEAQDEGKITFFRDAAPVAATG